MPTPVTDPDVLAQLNGGGPRPVSDPALLEQLNAAPSMAADVAKSGGIGLAKGLIQGAGLPGDAPGMIESAINAGNKKMVEMGVPGAVPRNATQFANPLPGAESIQHKVESVTGKFYEPQTTAGKFAQSAGEFVGNPVSYVGPGGLLVKAGTAAAAGIGSEAAGQATEGTKYEGAARLAGGIVGAGAAGMRRTGAPIPTTAELGETAGSQYAGARNMGVEVKAAGVSREANTLRTQLERDGIDAQTAPKTFAQLDKLETAPPGSFATWQNMESAKKTFGNIERDNIDPLTGKYNTEAAAAARAKHHLKDYLADVPPGDAIAGDSAAASALNREANANWAAKKHAELVDAKMERAALRANAANSGGNVANNIRSRVADLLLNKRQLQGYSPETVAQMRRVVEGTATGNIMRKIGNLLGGGGGIGQLAVGALGGELTAGHEGGVAGAIGLPLMGIMARRGSSASTLRQAKIMNEMVRSNSPLARQMARDMPPPSDSSRAAIARALLSQAGR